MRREFHVRFREGGGVRFPSATRLVIMAKYMGGRISTWVDGTVEGWLGLTINRKKTRVITLTPEGEGSLDFLGYTFRYEWDRFGRKRRFLTAVPSAKAVARRREDMRELISAQHSFIPLPVLMKKVNQKLRGWGGYFSFGHPRRAHRVMNAFVLVRLTKHLQRRSQRACRPPAGMSYYSFLTHRLGLELL